VSLLWTLRLPNDNRPFGFLTDPVVAEMPWTKEFEVDLANRNVFIKPIMDDDVEHDGSTYDDVITRLLDKAQSLNLFPQSLGKRSKDDEKWPILGTSISINIDRSAISLFGICGRGSHMMVYTCTGLEEKKTKKYRLWIPRRNRHKKSFPGMLDNTVAGGVATGETPLRCVIREMGEEAAIIATTTTNDDDRTMPLSSTSLVDDIRATGTITWMNFSDKTAGGEVGLVNPGILYAYDLEVGENVKFQPADIEDVESFCLMEVCEVVKALKCGEFKPSSGMVVIDFLIRHGLITEENEEDYVEIVSRLHRRLPFPTGRALNRP